MVGLDVNRFGLEFADIRAERIFDGTTPVLTISGTIVNITDKPRTVPGVRVDLRDDSGRDVESILIEPSESAIAPGAEVTFSSRLDSPSLEAYDLAVTFVATDGQIRLVDTGGQDVNGETSDHHETTDEHAAPGAHDETPSDDHGSDTSAYDETHDAEDATHAPDASHDAPGEGHAPADASDHGPDHDVAADTHAVDPHAADPHGEDHADHG